MKNYSEITVKYLKEKKKRTLFTIVGIIISLSLISGVGFLGLSLKDYMYNLIINDGGDYECSFNGINYKNIKALKYDVDLEKVAVTTYEGVFTDIKNEKENNNKKTTVKKEYVKTKEDKPKFSFKEQKEFETIYGDIDKLEEKIANIDKEMEANPSNYGLLNELTNEKEALEEELLYKYERVEYLEDLAKKIEEYKKK